jgi:predicted DNA-binding transcriptional regulator
MHKNLENDWNNELELFILVSNYLKFSSKSIKVWEVQRRFIIHKRKCVFTVN